MHPVLDAVKQGRKFEKILLKQGLEGDQFRQLMEEISSRGIAYQFVPGENELSRQGLAPGRDSLSASD